MCGRGVSKCEGPFDRDFEFPPGCSLQHPGNCLVDIRLLKLSAHEHTEQRLIRLKCRPEIEFKGRSCGIADKY